jgi:putative ABC transport system permease protein
MGKHLFLVWKNLLRNKRRTVLTVFSSGISVFLIGALISVYALMYGTDISEESAMRLVTRHKVSLTQALPYYYGARIATVDGVENMVPMNWFGGTYIDNRPENFFARFAVDPQEIFNIYSEYTIAPEQLEAFQRDRQGVAVGKTVAERVGLELGQRITIQGDIYPFDPELTVRAIFEGPDDLQSFFHFKYLEESVGDEYGSQVGVFAIRLRSAEDAPRVAAAVDEMFRNAPEPTKTETEAAFQLGFVNQMGNIKLFLLSIAAAIVFTMLMVSANTVAMSVRERTREIGVLKTLGFRRRSVMGLVLGEAVAIALLGGAVGVAITVAVTSAMQDIMVQWFTGFTLPPWGIGVCFAMALVVGLGSSAIPALIAARTTICDALRHTG